MPVRHAAEAVVKSRLPLSADPRVMGGRVVFAGTRVPVETLFEYLADGLSLDEIVDSFPTLDRSKLVIVLEDAARRYAERA